MLFIFVCFDFLARTLFLPQQKPDIFVSVLALYSFERGRVALTQKFEGQQVEIVVLFSQVQQVNPCAISFFL